MKKFKELKPGDKIYYWDHGKLHEQIVNKCEIVEREQSWTNWAGEVNINRYKELVIQAGKGKEYSLRYSQEYNTSNFGRMKRFADYESAKNWISSQKEHYKRKVNNFQNKVEKYKKLVEKYS